VEGRGRLAGHGPAFHDTTLTYWRRRLAASDDPKRIFHAVQQVIAQSGAIKGKTRRALDSTVLDDAVATQDTVTQLIAAVRRVRREAPGAAAVVARVTSAHDYDDPGEPAIAWDDKAAREQLIDALVRDALAVLEAVGDPEPGPAADALGLLALIAGQDVDPVHPDPDPDERADPVPDQMAPGPGPAADQAPRSASPSGVPMSSRPPGIKTARTRPRRASLSSSKPVSVTDFNSDRAPARAASRLQTKFPVGSAGLGSTERTAPTPPGAASHCTCTTSPCEGTRLGNSPTTRSVPASSSCSMGVKGSPTSKTVSGKPTRARSWAASVRIPRWIE